MHTWGARIDPGIAHPKPQSGATLFSEYPEKQFCGVVQRIQPAHDLWYWHHAAAMHLSCPPLETMRKCPTAHSRVHLVLSGLWIFL